MIFTFVFALLLSYAAQAHEGHHHGPESQEAKVIEVKPDVKSAYAQIQSAYAASVKPIFDLKCAACHSSEVAAPWYESIPLLGRIIESDRQEAKVHLEISKGFPFAGHGTPEEDLKAIREEVEKDEMPTGLYKLVHPSSRLTFSEKTIVLNWIVVSQKELAKFQKP